MNKLDVIVKLFLDFQKEHEVYKYINTICDLWVNYTNNEYKIQWRQTFPSFSEDYIFVNIPCSMTISDNDIMYELLKHAAIELGKEQNRIRNLCECGRGPKQEPHTCPFKIEIQDNYEKCTCCKECESDCRDNI